MKKFLLVSAIALSALLFSNNNVQVAHDKGPEPTWAPVEVTLYKGPEPDLTPIRVALDKGAEPDLSPTRI